MSENINNIPENEIPETEATAEVFTAPNNYLDFIVEDDVAEPKKRFSVTKLLAMIFGIISGLALLYYAVEFFNANRMQIEQYTQMGIQLPKISYVTIYLSVALTFIMSLCPIVGGLLPKKYAKCSVLLLAVPISYTLINALPQLIICIVNKIAYAEAYPIYFMAVSGILALAAAILNMFTGDSCCCCDEADVEFYEYEDDDFMELDEETEELLEEADKEVEELLEETKELTEEAQNDAE